MVLISYLNYTCEWYTLDFIELLIINNAHKLIERLQWVNC